MFLSVFFEGAEYKFFNYQYAISRDGKVLRKLLPAEPKPRNSDGYLCIGRNLLIHRMVAICWLEKPEEAHLVHHINGDRRDNRADNLEWVTPKQHMGERHASTAGRHIVSEEARKKMSAARTGWRDSDEVRERKAAILLHVSLRKRTCRVDGIDYRSIRAASIALKIHICTVRYRCLSKNFPNYQLVT